MTKDLSGNTERDNTILIGEMSPEAPGPNCICIGVDSLAKGQSSVAIGNGARAEADFSMAIGPGAVATKPYQVVIGDLSKMDSESLEAVRKLVENRTQFIDAMIQNLLILREKMFIHEQNNGD